MKKEAANAQTDKPDGRGGRVASWMMQTSTAAEKMTATCFGAVRGARGKLSARVLGLIEAAEAKQPALFARLRAANDRTNAASEAFIARVENAVLRVVRAARTGGSDATGIAASSAPTADAAHAA